MPLVPCPGARPLPRTNCVPSGTVLETEHAGSPTCPAGYSSESCWAGNTWQVCWDFASPELPTPGWFARQKQDFALMKHVLSSEVWTPFQKYPMTLWGGKQDFSFRAPTCLNLLGFKRSCLNYARPIYITSFPQEDRFFIEEMMENICKPVADSTPHGVGIKD